MSIDSEITEIDPVTVEVAVEVPWDRVKKSLDASYGKLQKGVRVRGFRPGKAPRNVLVQLYGPQVKNEVVATLVEEGLLAAVQTHELAVVASPEVRSLPTIAKGEPLAFKAKIEVRPKVEKVSVDGLEVEGADDSVSDDEVDAELARMRESQADIVTLEEERPSKEGDLLSIDYEVEIDGEKKEEMATTGRSVELGEGRLLPEFEEGLLGKKVGEEVEIRIAYDEENPNPELKNKRALFRVTITELREKLLPALDDEFAKDQGEYETLDELKAATREKLEKAAADRARSTLRERIVEALVEKNPVPVPPSLVSQQEQAMRQELAFLMQMAGGNFDFGGDDEMRERAEKKVRAALLMGELARQEEIAVEPEEVDGKLQEIADETGKHIAKVRVEYSGDKRESLENKLLEDKLLDFLLARATVSEPTEADEEEGEG